MPKLSFRTQILAGFILSLVLVISVFYFSYTSINNLQKNEKVVEHTESVIKAANTVQALLLDGEAGQLGYIATAKSAELEPYAKSIARVPGALIELKALTKDNPLQRINVDSLVAFANLKSDELRYIVEISRMRGFDTARAMLATVPGKYDMDKVRFYVSRIVNQENTLLAVRKTSTDNAAWTTINGIVVGGIIVVYVVFLLAFYIRSAFRKLQESEENLKATNLTLERINEELLTKAQLLQQSEEELKIQHDELMKSNAELEEKAHLLAEKNQAVEEARKAIASKVRELELANKYKSEFLANMSHELRTPLNSILVLAEVLRDNKPANLSKDQVKYASVIVNAGNDLLALINDILDLSKIESGKLEIQNETVKIADILYDAKVLFDEIATKKKMQFAVSVDKSLPGQIFTDRARVGQILKNLLSNAFKFTPDSGSVSVNVTHGETNDMISFQVIDTGIGIARDKQKLIFEAFQQADGSTSRKYGGTGLGLPICRELAALLGGKINLTSEAGVGSTFTLSVPVKGSETLRPAQKTEPAAAAELRSQDLESASRTLKDNHDESLVIIVEDDKRFAGILQDYANDHGCRSIILNDGTNAVETIRQKRPDAVILDIMLPGKDGWQILKELKKDGETSGIPVHLMSASEATVNRPHQEGAISFIKKPADNFTLEKLFSEMATQNGATVKQVLLVEDNEDQSYGIQGLMKDRGIVVDQAFDGKSALAMLEKRNYQCIILDLHLPDIPGLDLLDKIKADKRFESLPVIINTATDLNKDSLTRLMRYANAMISKSDNSPNRLINEVNVFLDKVNHAGKTAPAFIEIPVAKKSGENNISGKRVLIVDDDERNIFALSSALQGYGLEVHSAFDGQEALNRLDQMPGVDLVLMDVMMPKMDGYEATRHIRRQQKWQKLPIIALTAKAMADDRQKCIVAGANDYITKPVDFDRLVSLMQLWMNN